MPTTISTGWTPPPLSAVNISDCNAAAAWLGAIAQAGLDLPHETGQPFLVARMIPIDVSLDYVRSAIPSNYSPAPDDVDLFAWYTEFWINSTISDPESEQIKERAELFPLLNCSEKLCPALKWEGDPDVSGTGMIVTYYIEAVLSTIFLLASLFYELRQANRHSVHLVSSIRNPGARGLMARLGKGFKESADKFLDVALIFAAGYLLAAMCRFVSAYRHYLYDRPVPVYSLMGSIFMSEFSVFPAVMLQSFNRGMRRNLQRQVLWFFIIMLSIVLNIFLGLVGPRSTPDWTASNVDGTLAVTVHDMFWEQACDDIPFKQTLIGFYFVGLLVLIFNAVWWVGYTLSGWETAVNKIPQHLRERFKVEKIWRLWDHYEHRMRICNGSLLGALMWIFLGMFHRYSYILSQKAGGSDQDTEWTFGQVLAPVAFAQVAFDLIKHLPGHDTDKGTQVHWDNLNVNTGERQHVGEGLPSNSADIDRQLGDDNGWERDADPWEM